MSSRPLADRAGSVCVFILQKSSLSMTRVNDFSRNSFYLKIFLQIKSFRPCLQHPVCSLLVPEVKRASVYPFRSCSHTDLPAWLRLMFNSHPLPEPTEKKLFCSKTAAVSVSLLKCGTLVLSLSFSAGTSCYCLSM